MADETTGGRKSRRGFASMPREKQREIARQGGRAAHQKGTAHEWNAEEARTAGRKGGQASRRGKSSEPSTSQAESALHDRGESATWDETAAGGDEALANDEPSSNEASDER